MRVTITHTVTSAAASVLRTVLHAAGSADRLLRSEGPDAAGAKETLHRARPSPLPSLGNFSCILQNSTQTPCRLWKLS